jgi:hypothetical protein
MISFQVVNNVANLSYFISTFVNKKEIANHHSNIANVPSNKLYKK